MLQGNESVCERCGKPIVWVRTWHLDQPGRLSRWMPLDPGEFSLDDERANVAVSRHLNGGLVARVMSSDAPVPQPHEHRAMPHFPTCTGGRPSTPSRPHFRARRAPEPVPDDVVPPTEEFLAARAQLKSRRRRVPA